MEGGLLGRPFYCYIWYARGSKQHRMRVLHIIQRYYPYVGGSELYFKELSERLARAGHRVEVWTTDAWDLDYFWTKRARRIEAERDTHNGVHIRRFKVKHLPLPPI